MQFLNKNPRLQTPAGRVAVSGMLVALALIFSYIESLVPIALPIPGAKLGLANLITLTGLFFLSPMQVLIIIICRILLAGFMFGNFATIIYSLAGGLLSLLVMLIAKKTGLLSVLGISMLGGVFHNIGQLIIACLILKNTAPVIYLPYLILIGAIAGFLMGFISRLICTAFKNF